MPAPEGESRKEREFKVQAGKYRKSCPDAAATFRKD